MKNKKMLLFMAICFNFEHVFCENKVVIIKNEMDDVMKEHVTTAAQTYLKFEKDLNKVAQGLADSMNEKYGKNWNCLASESSCLHGYKLEHLEKNFIWFSIENNSFIVYKTNETIQTIENKENFQQLVNKTKNSNFTAVVEFLPDLYKRSIFEAIIRDVLNKGLTCESNEYFKCYDSLSYEISNILGQKYPQQKWIVIAYGADMANFNQYGLNFTHSTYRIGPFGLDFILF